jgi:hypothetical protein
MRADSHAVDLFWKELAASYGMQQYRHGLGLLRGCFRQLANARLAVNERPQGLDFIITGGQRPGALLFWADEAFLQWCRLRPQVQAAERAHAAANRLGFPQSASGELSMRPHRADESPLTESNIDLSRFRRLGGSCAATDLCVPAMLAPLPENVSIENSAEQFRVYFPTLADPNIPFRAVTKIAGLQL